MSFEKTLFNNIEKYGAKVSDRTVANIAITTLNILSVNVGSFGKSPEKWKTFNPNNPEAKRQKMAFLKWVEVHQNTTHVLSLQDFPDDKNLWEKLSEKGWEIHFHPNLLYDLSARSAEANRGINSLNSGVALLINRNLVSSDVQLESPKLVLASPDIYSITGEYHVGNKAVKQIGSGIFGTINVGGQKITFSSIYQLFHTNPKQRLVFIQKIIRETENMQNPVYMGDLNLNGWSMDERMKLFGLDILPKEISLPDRTAHKKIKGILISLRNIFRSKFVDGKWQFYPSAVEIENLEGFLNENWLEILNKNQPTMQKIIAKYLSFVFQPDIVFASKKLAPFIKTSVVEFDKGDHNALLTKIDLSGLSGL